MTAIYRYEVPVDGSPHTHELSGEPVYAACRRPGVVEFWAFHDVQAIEKRTFLVVGTGWPFPDEAVEYHGTALYGDLVWHLIELG